MKNYTRLYLNEMGYDESDFVPCEIPECGRRCIDVHHIDCRGAGGSKTKDTIENLIGLCREHHIEYGDKKQYKDFLKNIINERNANSN